jgi:hypothetical protein
VPDEAVRAKDLPRLTKLIVTKPRRSGGLVCFRMQKRYTDDIANTETYVIRDDDLYLVGLLVQASGQSREVRPVPAVLFAGDAGSRWSGQFSGRTSGSYSATGLGRRTYTLHGKGLRVTGLRSSVSYRGAVTGRQVTTIWISPDEGLIVSENVTMRERLGVNDFRLGLRRQLVRPRPETRGVL